VTFIHDRFPNVDVRCDRLQSFTLKNGGRIGRKKRIMLVQHGGTALLGLFNVLLNAFILSFIT